MLQLAEVTMPTDTDINKVGCHQEGNGHISTSSHGLQVNPNVPDIGAVILRW